MNLITLAPLPFALLPVLAVLAASGLVVSWRVQRGRRAPVPARTATKGASVKRRFFMLLPVVAVGALVFASTALAVTVPAVPVSSYGSALLTSLADAIADIFPYAAAITAFAIAVGMVKRWLGHRKATRV